MNAQAPITAPKPKRVRGHTRAQSEAPDTAAEIPARPVIQHTAIHLARLQMDLSATQSALDLVNHRIAAADGERILEHEAADRARDMAVSFADQKHGEVTGELGKERDDLTRTLEGIEAGIAALSGNSAPTGQQESGE